MVASGKIVAYRILGLPEASNVAMTVRVWTAYLISGCFHQLGDYAVIGSWWAGGSLLFFMIHAAAVTAEDWIIRSGRRLGISGKSAIVRCIGYAWVLGWLAISAPILQNPIVGAGMASVSGESTLVLDRIIRVLA